MDEWSLNRLIHSKHGEFQAAQREGVAEFPVDLPLMFEVLLEKSNSPRWRLQALRDCYQSTRDFRLLAMGLAAIEGRSAAQSYEAVSGMMEVCSKIQEEAAMDRLHRELIKRRGAARNSIDRRASWLLQFKLHAIALKQNNGGEAWVAPVLEALKSAFAEDWAAGERLAYTELLKNLDLAGEDRLVDEALRQLAELQRDAKRGETRFRIARIRAEYHWNLARRDKASSILMGALSASRASDGRFPNWSFDEIYTLGRWYRENGEWMSAESLYEEELSRAYSIERRRGLEHALFNHCVSAYRYKHPLKRGRGIHLYGTLRDTLIERISACPSAEHAKNLIGILASLFGAGCTQAEAESRADIEAFAFRRLPGILKSRRWRFGAEMIGNLTPYVLSGLGRHRCTEFLLACEADYPEALLACGRSFWADHSARLEDCFHPIAGISPDLDMRVLPVVLDELRRDLSTGQLLGRYIYDLRRRESWKSKRATFRRCADQVADARPQERDLQKRVAEYLEGELDLPMASAELLLRDEARRGGDDELRFMLGRLLVELKRFDEARPRLEAVVASQPLHVEAWVNLLHSLQNAPKSDLLAALARAEAALLANRGQAEGLLARLGSIAGHYGLDDEALRLVDEAIALRRRARQGASGHDGTMNGYLVTRSLSLARLGRMQEAIDSACAAIVAWAGNVREQGQARMNLVRVLGMAPQPVEFLDALSAELDAASQENPRLREAIGEQWMTRNAFAKAASAFERALEQRPDARLMRRRVEALDGAGRPEDADRALLALAEMEGRDPALYIELGDRLAKRERSAEAERAYTNAVELSPEESEGHAALAAIRSRQKRPLDAAWHWGEVFRIRSLEPTGLIEKTAALIAAGRIEEAREGLKLLDAKTWPGRFHKVLGERLPELRKALF